MISLDTIAAVVIPTSLVITIFFMYMYYREWVKSQKSKESKTFQRSDILRNITLIILTARVNMK